MFKCKICESRFSETHNTIFFGSRYSEETIHSIIRSVAEGNGVRATARMLGLNKDSVNRVILMAGEYSETVMNNLLKNLHLKECQMDELWSFISKKNVGHRRISKGIRHKMVWTALSPDNKLIICYKIGDRTLSDCRVYFKKLLQRVTNKPLFTSDELVHYKSVLLENFSTEEEVCPTGKRGRPRKGNRIIDKELDYVVVQQVIF
jgi:hypothetical protein